ncbi:sugar phosphate isomerase/epimerase family protein [Oceanobacillus timonensis]|uniref:sugar phosphate isomerase/epimerase family protein n=1 Tax=Oceanobacillus timonensis TaxID=1926285 RepID=UPI0009BA2E7E|nr:TIM barrel protein [Oceanobacillus timonensis]
MNNYFIPSLLIAETYFPVKDERGFTADIIEKSTAEGFYQSFEIGDIQNKEERKRILSMKEKNDVVITEWLTFLIDRNQLDVSSLDQKLRLQTVQQLKDNIYLAAECGASNIAFITGPDPGSERRKKGMDGLFESLCSICEEAEKYNITVLVEHLDRIADKKRILGPIDETVQLLLRVKENYQNIGLAFDTAHSALNGENILEAIEEGSQLIQQIHFSNAVLDPLNELYGDNHMPIGSPGFLNNEKIFEILQKAEELDMNKEFGMRVAIEARTPSKEKLEESAENVKNLLDNALNLVNYK